MRYVWFAYISRQWPTSTWKVVFISCKPPVDPVKLVTHHLENVERTGVTRTKRVSLRFLPLKLSQCSARHVLRLVPVSASCVASTPEILVLAQKIIPSAFASLPDKTDGSRKYRVSSKPALEEHHDHT